MTSPTPPQTTPPAPLPSPLEESVDLFDLAIRFLIEWPRLLLVSFAVFVLCVLYIYSIKPLYEADSTVLPQGQDAASGNNLASLFSTRSPGDIFIGLLGSRSVEDNVIDRVGLLDHYKTKSRAIARAMLAGSSVFSVGRDTLVTIKVRDSNAEMAAQIANAYLDALQTQRETMLDREAELHDRFFQQQMHLQSDALAAAEQDLEKTQQKTGVVQPEAQTNIGLNAIAQVQAQITGLQVQLAAVRLGATDQNPQVRDLESQIAQLESKERSLESAGGSGGPGAAASAKQMPELNLDYSRKLREVRYHEALFNSISNQYETARLSEGYSGAPFVVVDHAIVPERKAWPPRFPMVLVSFAVSVFLGCVYVALLLFYRGLAADPLHAARLQQLRDSVWRRR